MSIIEISGLTLVILGAALVVHYMRKVKQPRTWTTLATPIPSNPKSQAPDESSELAKEEAAIAPAETTLPYQTSVGCTYATSWDTSWDRPYSSQYEYEKRKLKNKYGIR
jgi:hypothetical protein